MILFEMKSIEGKWDCDDQGKEEIYWLRAKYIGFNPVVHNAI